MAVQFRRDFIVFTLDQSRYLNVAKLGLAADFGVVQVTAVDAAIFSNLQLNHHGQPQFIFLQRAQLFRQFRWQHWQHLVREIR